MWILSEFNGRSLRFNRWKEIVLTTKLGGPKNDRRWPFILRCVWSSDMKCTMSVFTRGPVLHPYCTINLIELTFTVIELNLTLIVHPPTTFCRFGTFTFMHNYLNSHTIPFWTTHFFLRTVYIHSIWLWSVPFGPTFLFPTTVHFSSWSPTFTSTQIGNKFKLVSV